jgi:hypothetical protein
LVKAGTTFSHGQPYQANSATSATGTNAYIVGVNHNLSCKANGVWNGQATTIAANAFFWGQFAGQGAVLNDDGASIAANIACRASDSGIVAATSVQGGVAAQAFRTLASVTTAVTVPCIIGCEQI